MNRLLNRPEESMNEMIDGYIQCYPDKYERLDGYKVILRKNLEDKVSVIIGAGGGNEPWPIGYVGEGMADACACGDVFTAPAARAILNTLRSVPNKDGVLCVATNHAGDVLNFELVAELAEMEGIKTRRVYVADDITSADLTEKRERRGIAGVSLVLKIAAAAAKTGLTLDEVAEVAQKVSDNTYTCSVTTSPAYVLETGKPAYDLPEGKTEYGMGFNGEMGIERTDISSADKIAEKIINMIIEDANLKKDDEVIYFLNPFMATTFIESYIIAGKCLKIFADRGIKVYASHVDTMFATQGAGGFSVTILKVNEKIKEYYNKPVNSPSFRYWEQGERK
ncbi:dihydroxyacetone kinase-like protein [Muricomes intestini]|uniref:Dihydroxyacetone kinase-like protein n=1 Tax=Muricomes intestini TaxID=1796634 RepID=A0A4R3KCX8_9FIRM|nr:dihydroxyacetone kinase subunit DhaK [Muricomes intestini]TCS81096.1 dihydroxyacetone kinase-like protein [Muricomes intestini]